VLFSTRVPRYVVDIDAEYPVDEDGIRINDAWWSSTPTQRSSADLGSEASIAILGEPGIGKSTAIGELIRDDLSVNYVHLDEATDVRALDSLLALTTRAPCVERATLVLDGVDECPLAPKTLVRRVVSAIDGLTDVRVIVGCRTADWPASLGESLLSALGSFDVVELLPLSAEDIVALASSRGADGANFLDAARRSGAGPLAALPLTLDLLLTIYAQQGGLPANAKDLYDSGLMLLANESDPRIEPRIECLLEQ
jgi:hypothetical protein